MTATESQHTAHEPEPYRHEWDDTPHTIWAGVPVDKIALGDFLMGGSQCVTGAARAEHRGKPAIRFDVENMATGGKGRIVLTLGQRVGDVKRYEFDEPSPSVPPTDDADSPPDIDPLLEAAWNLIANASNWRDNPQSEWIGAAERWRAQYHARLAAR